MTVVGGESEPSSRSARPPRQSVDVQAASERLLDDEALRGDLSDFGFAPILEVALALILRRSDRFGSTDSLADAARSFVRSAVAVADSGQIADFETALDSPLFEPTERVAILGTGLRECADADSRAKSIADCVARTCELGSAG